MAFPSIILATGQNLVKMILLSRCIYFWLRFSRNETQSWGLFVSPGGREMKQANKASLLAIS